MTDATRPIDDDLEAGLAATRAREALDQAAGVDASRITVVARSGALSLSGRASSREEAARAVRLAEEAAGVSFGDELVTDGTAGDPTIPGDADVALPSPDGAHAKR